MYFEIEDYKPDIQPIGRAISWREGVLLSIIVHLMMVILVLLAPRLFPSDPNARARALVAANPNEPAPRFVFVQPRIDRQAPRPPDRGEASDKDRVRRSPQRVPNPKNDLPFSRGNTPERVENLSDASRSLGPKPDPSEGKAQEDQQAENDGAAATPVRVPESQSALRLPSEIGTGGRMKAPGGLGDAIRNVQRYVQRDMFDNVQGGGQFGPEIQFDTKGVEFGPWIRRFVAQVKRNWLVPLSAMSLKGHVVITFNVHKDGSLTDVTVIDPCPIEPFNTAAKGALIASNPTQPLPPEYPTEKAFFTVTFYYNEAPPR